MGLLTLSACIPAPVGDPRTSKADSRLVGVWEWRDGLVHRTIFRQWDGTACVTASWRAR